MRRRWFVLLPLLAGSAWLAWFGETTSPGSAVVLATVPSRENAPRRPLAGRADGALPSVMPRDVLIPRREAAPRDLFPSQSWAPAAPKIAPPPTPLAPLAPAMPSAPPVPFTYLGKKFEGGMWEVFLGRGDQSFVVREGATIDNLYRVDKVQPPLLTLTYLPLAATQTITIGEIH